MHSKQSFQSHGQFIWVDSFGFLCCWIFYLIQFCPTNLKIESHSTIDDMITGPRCTFSIQFGIFNVLFPVDCYCFRTSNRIKVIFFKFSIVSREMSVCSSESDWYSSRCSLLLFMRNGKLNLFSYYNKYSYGKPQVWIISVASFIQLIISISGDFSCESIPILHTQMVYRTSEL